MRFNQIFLIALLFVSGAVFGQNFTYTSGSLEVDVVVQNPCMNGATLNRGYIAFTIVSTADNKVARLNNIVGNGGAGPNFFTPTLIPVGSTLYFYSNNQVSINNTSFTPNIGAGTYEFIIEDSTATEFISTFSPTVSGLTLTTLADIVINQNTLTHNTDCTLPLEGQIVASITGGSLGLVPGTPPAEQTSPESSFNYTWTSNNGVIPTSQTGTWDGTTPLDLAALLSIPALPGGTYTLLVEDNYSSCSETRQFTVLDPSPDNSFTVGTTTPSICVGTDGVVTLSGSGDGSVAPGVIYEVYNTTTVPAGVPTGITLTETGGALSFTIPAATILTAPGTYTFRIFGDNGDCTPVFMTGSASITVSAIPTITLGASPSVCLGATNANQTYSATTGSPNQYSIDFNAAAEAVGFVDVTTTTLPASPIGIAIPGTAVAGTYNATLTIRNSTSGCSSTQPISVTINALPTITLGANPAVCLGATSANLTYSATTGGPNRYSINFNGAAEAQGFVDVTNAVLGASPIVITVPGSAATGTYNATITVRNNATNCTSAPPQNISVTINPSPTITLGANPAVCAGATSANLTYSAVTGSPTQLSINFDAAAEAQGFIDITNGALPASPIVITVPGAAVAGTYNATLSVRNNTTGCSSAAQPITVTINPSPAITLGANPSVCLGVTSANLTYTTPIGSPDQFSINFDAAAEAQGFIDVTNATLPASPIAIIIPGGAVAGTYNATLTVRNATTNCASPAQPISVTIGANPTITLGTNPSVCSGATSANLTYSATTGTPNQYSINFDAAAEAQGFADVSNITLPASPIVIIVPGAAAIGTYNATLTVHNSTAGCNSTPEPISVTITTSPTITLGTNPSVCAGVTSANLNYSATTGSPNQYSIDFNGAAEAQGFLDVTNVTLNATPIVITVPGGAVAGTYNATLTVHNTVAGCSSTGQPISVTINALPTITLGANPEVCSGTTSANLTFSATTGSPNRYTINFNPAAEAQGFVDVTNAVLSASPIVITVPGAAAGTYNATLTVRNNGTNCVSTVQNISVTINATPAITLGANPSVCLGAATANLTYSSPTGTPDQFTIDFDAAAEAQGFTDVTNATLTASPIVITIPGGAVVGTYNATLTVRNTTTNCVATGQPISVTITNSPTITLGANPSVCTGATSANLTYSAITASPDQFSVDFDAAAEAQGFIDITNATLNASPIVITIPGGAVVGTYNGTLTVRNSTAGCSSAGQPISVTIETTPTITLGTNPSVCLGATSANLTYSATTGSPNQYSIDFNAAAEAQGFTDITNATLNASPIVITIPGGVVAGTYNATLSVRNSVAGCGSSSQAISVTINAIPAITLGANPSVCIGTANANLTYSGATGSPNQFSIDFNAAAEAQGFTDIVNATLTASPIVITIPGGAVAGTYNATISVRNSTTGCSNIAQAISVTINPSPTITLGANPSVCAGTTSANLTYSAITGSPDEYSIDFNAAAEAQGFADVTNATLTASPIVIAVPGGAAPGTYSATLNVLNNSTGCSGAGQTISVTIDPIPTITLGVNPSICAGATSANLTYSATTGSPNQYSINFNAAAEAQGFTDVVNATLTTSPIVITVPGSAALGTYNATLTVRNSGGGCTGASQSISVTINASPNAGVDNAVSACSSETAFDLFASLGGTPDSGGTWTDLDASGGVITGNTIDLTAVAVGTYDFEYTVTGTAPCASASAVVSVTVINSAPDAGGDNTVSACENDAAFNLFTNLTGTPDPGGSWTDLDTSGATINGDEVDLTGVAIGNYRFQYTITAGTCGSSSAIVTVDVIGGPDAGLDNTVSACNTETAFDLFANLDGTPDSGGTWTDLDGSGVLTGSTINTTTLAAGAYRYQYAVTATAPCIDASAIVTVNVVESPDAGADNAVPACNNDSAFDLLANLNGTPDAGGTWTQLTGATRTITSNAVDLVGAVAGAYTFEYRVEAAPCADAVAVLTVNVVDSPDAGLDNSVTACNTETAFDLFANLDGTPDAGGTWGDLDTSGAPITGNTVDLTSLAAGTYRFEYTVTGATPCADATAIVTVDVITTAPSAGTDNTVSACNTDTAFDLFGSLLGSPNTGGTWTDMDGSGAVITGDNVNLTGLAVDTYRYQYTITVAGCGTSSAIVTVDVEDAPNAGTNRSVTACTTNTTFNLLTSLGGTPDNGGAWTDMDGSGAVIAGNLADFSGTTPGSYRYQYTVTGTAPCANASAILTVQVNICAGGNCATVEITPQPSPATCTLSNGSIHFDIDPAVPAVNNTGVRIDITGPVNRTNLNNPDFAGLPIGEYSFVIQYGDPSCIIPGVFTIDQSGTVGEPIASNPTSPNCFGSSTGSVTIDVAGETGNPLQWSLTPADPASWVNFSAGQPGGVTGLPAGNLLISIRRTSADPCNAAVFVTITETASELTATFTTTSATCGNSDGSITVTPGGPYSYEIDGVPTVPVANVFSNLNGGNHVVTLISMTTGCERDITVTVPFPGLVDTTPLSTSSGSCTSGGAIFFFIENAGSVNYEIGYTTDLFSEPTNYSSAYYNPPVSPSNDGFVQIPGLPRGDYYIWVRSASVQCPTRVNSTAESIGGAYAVSFEVGCRETNGDLSLTNITGAPGIPFTYEIDGPSLLTGTLTPDVFGNAVISGFGGTVAYKVRLRQDQNSIAGCPDVRSTDEDAPEGSLDITSVDNAESFPDQPTGTMLVKIQESFSAPYEVWVVDNTTLVSTDTLIAVRNPVIFESNFTNMSAGSYTVYVEDARGCRKMVSNDLPLDTDIFIPNIFTPNDDGLNEKFYVRNLPNGSKLSVTNRWGKEVYSSGNYNLDNLWDGGGSPDGVYFYRLQIKGGDTYTGWVEILRGTKP